MNRKLEEQIEQVITARERRIKEHDAETRTGWMMVLLALVALCSGVLGMYAFWGGLFYGPISRSETILAGLMLMTTSSFTIAYARKTLEDL